MTYRFKYINPLECNWNATPTKPIEIFKNKIIKIEKSPQRMASSNSI